MNILNKEGMLTTEQRKEPLVKGMNHVTFRTCLDLSQGIVVEPYGTRNEMTLQQWNEDLAAFISFWNQFVLCDLNGFSGFSHIKYTFPDGFVIRM